MTDDILTLDEITRRYPDQWVLIGDPRTNAHQGVEAGRVLFASPDRDQVYEKAISLPVPRDIAVHFTGEFPDDMVFVL